MVKTEGFHPQTGEWNDSLAGDFIWGNANIGEALSGVVTPYTWSVIGAAYARMTVLPGYPIAGNIGGRLYQNGTVMMTTLKALGKDVDAMLQEMGGSDELPPGLTVPLLPVSWWDRGAILLNGLRLQLREQRALRALPHFLAENPAWCAAMRRRAERASDGQALLDLLPEIEAHIGVAFWSAVSTVWRYAEAVSSLRHELAALVGEVDTNTLLSNVSSDSELLASLGPVVGLSRVARGDMLREAYLEQYGHRGPHEAECAAPRPAEDPAWIDVQLAQLGRAAVDVEEMLVAQREAFAETWERFRDRYPRRATYMKQRLAKAAEVSRNREAVRSELTRQVWVGRTWALRAGELMGLGEGIFYLTLVEVQDLLRGKAVPVETIPVRQETHARYLALPPYPPLISGQFDPFAWAADPHRRNDYFDSHRDMPKAPDFSRQGRFIAGVPGSAGQANGLVRRIDRPEEGDQLQPGEILVTSQTNVGWTLLFPKAAAVVTDVGAPLSHAAIVARELGIPAVLGCGNATTILQDGDRVRVDGGRGIVEILDGG